MLRTTLIVPSPRQVCSQLAGHLRGSPEGSDARSEETTAATYTGMCIFGIAFSLGYTVGAYLIGSKYRACRECLEVVSQHVLAFPSAADNVAGAWLCLILQQPQKKSRAFAIQPQAVAQVQTHVENHTTRACHVPCPAQVS